MSTLIENVNDIVLIKEELDALLNEYGVDGGEQFDTYPEKFRELFRLIQDSTTIAVDTLYQEVDTVTIVADPVIWQSDNIIQITCATVDAVIYYRMVGLDTGTDWGETEYKNKFYISENAHIEAYAMDKNKQYRSGTVWINAEYVLGDVPEKPVINRDRTTGDVTMSCATDGASIYFRNGGSDWTLYTGEVYIPLADDIYAYSVKDGVASDIVFDEGLDDTVRPAIPVISYSNNTITITDATEGANIYYRERLSDTWILYEGPVTISESGWYVAIAYKDGIYSEQTDPPLFCEYVSPIPAVPEISCENNTVTITCDTLGATIYYKEEDSDTWLIYSEPFTITETTTIESKSFKNGYYSDVVSVECEYDDSGSGGGGDTPSYQKPEKPEMSLYYNTVTITCATEGATIYWMYLLDNEWIEYEGPFQISKSGYYVSKAVKNDVESDLSDVAYFEWDSEIDYIVPAVPSIDCYANEVSISCSTEDADIYYRIGTSGSFSIYTTPFSISDTVTVYSYSTLNGVDSDTTSKECVYYETPTAPIIVCEDNIVSITSPDGGTILFKKTGDTYWNQYVSGFRIYESSYYDAKVVKNGIYSSVTTTLCSYDSESGEEYDVWYSYRTIPFTVEALDDGYIQIYTYTNYKFYYKINGNITTNQERIIDTTDWTYATTSARVSVSSGDKIYILNQDKKDVDYDWNPGHFNFHGVEHNISGNFLSLFYGKHFLNHLDEGFYPARGTEILSVYEQFGVEDTADLDLISAKYLVLPNVLNNHVHSPNNPIITQNNFISLFEGCTNLVEAPYILPATELTDSCYMYMFNHCHSLTSAPLLPAQVLTEKCYMHMFYDCTSLENIPTLSATSLADSCYRGMFYGNASITSSPSLPATTLANLCYADMFNGCTSLVNAPQLPATTLKDQCYFWMFAGCTSLSAITCLATTGINVDNSTKNWVKNISSTGTFTKASGVTWPSGDNGIPSGWTVQEV